MDCVPVIDDTKNTQPYGYLEGRTIVWASYALFHHQGHQPRSPHRS